MNKNSQNHSNPGPIILSSLYIQQGPARRLKTPNITLKQRITYQTKNFKSSNVQISNFRLNAPKRPRVSRDPNQTYVQVQNHCTKQRNHQIINQGSFTQKLNIGRLQQLKASKKKTLFPKHSRTSKKSKSTTRAIPKTCSKESTQSLRSQNEALEINITDRIVTQIEHQHRVLPWIWTMDLNEINDKNKTNTV